MSESAAWSTLKDALKSHKDILLPSITRVENAVASGTPDTFMSGAVRYNASSAVPMRVPGGIWFEGKHVKSWPVRGDTAVNIGLSKVQANKLFSQFLAEFPCGVWVRVSDGLRRYPLKRKDAWLWYDAHKLNDPMLFTRLAARSMTSDEAINHAQIFETAHALAGAIIASASEWTTRVKPITKPIGEL